MDIKYEIEGERKMPLVIESMPVYAVIASLGVDLGFLFVTKRSDTSYDVWFGFYNDDPKNPYPYHVQQIAGDFGFYTYALEHAVEMCEVDMPSID